MLTYFNNDISFKINDLKILKKYQYYLGLDNIDNNSEDNNTNNNCIENINGNGYFPYLFTPTGTGVQFNPLFNPSNNNNINNINNMILNPQIISNQI